MQTIELERDYRAACQKMLASLDLRTALNRINDEIARLHQALTVEGSQILSNPALTANDESIKRYRAMVENVVAKLDERDQLRSRDSFKEALQDLLQLGEQLGFARRGEPSKNESLRVEKPEPAKPERAPVASRPVVVEPAAEDAGGFSSVERELAELQQQLVHLHQGAV